MFCSPCKINTVTCLYNLNIKIDLDSLSNNLQNDPRLTIENHGRSFNLLKIKYLHNNIKSTIKIHKSGTILLVGALKSVENTIIVLNYLKDKIDPNIIINRSDIKIMLINGSFQLFKDSELKSNLTKRLNLLKCQNKIKERYNIECYRRNVADDLVPSYISLDLTLYWCDDHKLSLEECPCGKSDTKNIVHIYRTGIVVIVGSKSFEQLYETYNFLIPILTSL
jgi:TATA-box binding protein (TBP) (component of TFIID and TFIIIB)